MLIVSYSTAENYILAWKILFLSLSQQFMKLNYSENQLCLVFFPV